MNHNTKSGFTIIELMFSTTFIAVMLIAIAVCTIQISRTYERGLTVKEVNQVGRTLSDEFKRTIGGSAPFSVVPNSGGHYIQQGANGSGRLCTGTFSYIWNAAPDLAAGAVGINRYPAGTTGKDPIHLVKLEDRPSAYCTPNAAGTYPDASATAAVELLRTGDRQLTIHALTVDSPEGTLVSDPKNKQRLYSLSFTLGTSDMSEVEKVTSGAIEAQGYRCKPPANGDLQYCSVNRFTVIARAGNTVR